MELENLFAGLAGMKTNQQIALETEKPSERAFVKEQMPSESPSSELQKGAKGKKVKMEIEYTKEKQPKQRTLPEVEENVTQIVKKGRKRKPKDKTDYHSL